jgi:pimeloyl-ACP methyl ester carboxylesterase
VAIGANIDPSGFVPEDQHERAVPAETVRIVDKQYAELSPDGPEHAAVVEAKLHAMWEVEPTIPAATLGAITAPTLVMAGQHDMVSLEHTALIVDSIPHAQMCVVPGASHLLTVERPGLIGVVVREFLDALA